MKGRNRRMIREFQEQDLDQVMSIWLNMNIKAHDFIPETYWKENYEMVKGLFRESRNMGTTILVAVEDKNVLGFIGLNGAYIEGLFIKEAFWSRGIGRSLISEAKKYSRSLELKVYEKNQRALEFYKKMGFALVRKEKEGATGEAELVMRLR